MILKNIIKRFLYSLFCIKHNQDNLKKNILLFSTRRGGSTWLTQIIKSSSEKIRYIDHALGWYRADYVERKLLPNNYLGQLFEFDNKIKEYMNLCDNGKLIIKTPWNPLDRNFVRISDRILYKITEAKSLINDFIQLNKYHVIYQVRHPIPTSLSIMKLKWGLTAEAYLNNQKYVNKFLSKELVLYSRKILEANDILKKYILNWCLENLPAIRILSNKKILLITYEETVLYPDKIIRILVNKCNLINSSKMLRESDKPSKSTSMSSERTKHNIALKNGKFLISKWRKNIDSTYEKELFQILKKFKIDIYKYQEDFANKKYLIVNESR